MITLHILSSTDSPVHINNRIDPFAIAIVKFIKNMQHLGYRCIHYGIVGSEVDCEFVNCLPFKYPDHSTNLEIYNSNAAKEIAIRKSPNDLIMCFHGWENRAATESNSDLLIVEPSIGYDIAAIFSPYRVFTSYSQMHMYYGRQNMLMSPSWFDAVIPNAFSTDEFDFSSTKKDYILYFGRVVEMKGINVAIQATEATGTKLIIAGPGTLMDLGYDEIPEHVTCVGLCNSCLLYTSDAADE